LLFASGVTVAVALLMVSVMVVLAMLL